MSIFRQNEGGHTFDFSTRVCHKCDMSWETFQDNNKPECSGKKLPKPKEPQLIE